MITNKREVVVMELALANGEKLLFFVNKPLYDHQDITEKGTGGNFYYYNSGTCPINWLDDVAQIACVDKSGHVEMDPHGIFSLTTTLVPEIDAPKDCMDRDDFYLDIALKYLAKENEAIEFITQVKNNASVDVIAKAWGIIAYDRQALMSLSKYIFEEDIVLEITLVGSGYEVYADGLTYSIQNVCQQMLDRIKFLLEFDILHACRF